LGSRISLTYKRLMMKILRRTYEKSYEVSKIGPWNVTNAYTTAHNCSTRYSIEAFFYLRFQTIITAQMLSIGELKIRYVTNAIFLDCV